MQNTKNNSVALAREWIGTPYLHQGMQKGIGCDCLGLICGVWQHLNGKSLPPLPPYSANWRDETHANDLEQMATAYLAPILPDQCVPGDILLFRFRADLPAKHCAILSTPQHFIHAQERLGVVEVSLSAWWKRKIFKTFRFLES